jgi:hypothetical protein
MNQLKRIAGADFALLTVLCAVILGVATLFGATGCDNGSNKCDCENKIHGNSACNCGGIDCTCEQEEWTLNYGIKLDNQSGAFIGKNGQIALINTVLSDIYNNINAGLIDGTIYKNGKIIVESNSYTGHFKNGNNINISIDAFVNESLLNTTLQTALTDLVSLKRFDFNIRLANGNNMNAKDGWVVHQREFSGMARQRLKNSRVYGV